MAVQQQKYYYGSIQALRGLAALAVIFIHVSEMLLRYTDGQGLFCQLSPLWYTGAAGIDLFFIISGFVMAQSSRSMFQQQGGGRRFLSRRFLRIIPLYWMYTSLMLVLVLLPFTLKGTVFSWSYTVKSYLFILAPNPVTGLDLPLLPLGWTLCYEMYFYLIFALLLRFSQRVFLPSISLFFLFSVVTGFLFNIQNSMLTMLTNPLLLEFVLGCSLAWLINRKEVTVPVSSLLLITGMTLLILSSFFPAPIEYRFVIWGIPMSLITAGLVFLEKEIRPSFPRLLLQMGNSSYSTYLSHIFILLVIATLLKRDLMPQFFCNDLLAVISVILCLFFGHLFYRFSEKPLSRNLLSKRRVCTGTL